MTEDRSKTLALPDGRTLAYAEHGDPDGVPVVHATGGNDSRLEAASFDADATTAGVRSISTDRPGFGRSSFQPGREGSLRGDVAPVRVLYALARWAPYPVLRSVQRAMSDPDRNVTPENVRRLRSPDAELLTRRPDALEIVPGEAHLSLLANHGMRILEDLIA